MKRKRQYISRILVASVFFVFNVGLPVIIDACPMSRPAGSMMCPMCSADAGDAHQPVVKGKPCCAPQIAAERNSNEFLRVQKSVPVQCPVPCAVLTSPVIKCSPVRNSASYASTRSRCAPDDIPVLQSSLLI